MIIPKKYEFFNHTEQYFGLYFDLFLLIGGSSPYASTLFAFLCRTKKRKKYTSVFGRFWLLKTKNWASKQPIDRSEALFCLILPYFCPKCRKKRLLPW